MPPLALQLSVAHRARARGREPACRGDVPAARLHRRVDRERRARFAPCARAELHARTSAARRPCRRRSRSCSNISRLRGAARPDRTDRPGAAHRRGERHRLLRPRRQRDHRCDRRARAARAQRDPVGRRRREHALAHAAARLRQAAHRAQADGRRRPLARGVRLLRPSGVARGRHAVCAAGRRASTCIRRSSSTASGCGRCPTSSAGGSFPSSSPLRNVPAARSAPIRRPTVSRSSMRISRRFRRTRRLRAIRTGSGVRPRVLPHRRQDVLHQPGAGRDRAADLRRVGVGVSCIRAACALDSHRERQLLRGDDVIRKACR